MYNNKQLSAVLLSVAALASLQLALVVCAPNFDENKALALISDDDLATLNYIKVHMSNNYEGFKSVDEVLSYLDKVRLMTHKHPKNVAFAKDEQRELHRFLSSEPVAKLARLDSEPFVDLSTDEKIAVAQKAVEHDELTKKLFGTPLEMLIEKRRVASKSQDPSHETDKNFFVNLWCKLSNCNQ